MSRWQEPFGPGRPGDERKSEREGEGRIESIIRKSERDRIVAWLRQQGVSSLRVQSLADDIEAGEHWK